MKLFQRLSLIGLIAYTGLSLVACSSGSSSSTPTLTGIAITTPTTNNALSMQAGHQTTLAVTATYSDNSTQADTGVTYTLSGVSPAGSVTLTGASVSAIAAGTATVTATDTASGKTSAPYVITVTPAAVTTTSIAITTPSSSALTLAYGSTQTLVTSSTNSAGVTAVDSGVTYALSNVSPAGSVTLTGSTITGAAAGTATVIATDTATGLTSSPLSVTVTTAPISKIAITSPSTSTLALTVGQTSTFAVTSTHADGSSGVDTGVTYASSGSAVTVSGSTITAAAVGTATVTATDTATGLKSSPVTVTVAAAPVVDAVFTNNYATGVTFVGFDGANSTPVMTVDTSTTNPNTSATASLKIVVPASNTDGYVGGMMIAAAPANLSQFNAVTFWAKASAPTTSFKVGIGQDGSATSQTYQAEVIGLPITTTWTKFIIPIPDPSKFVANSGLFYFADGDNNYNVWLNNIQYETLSSVPTATAVTGNFPAVSVAVGATSTALSSANGSAPNTITFSGLDNASGQENNVGWGWYTLTSSTPSVATVDNTGLITGVATGTSTITAKMGSLTVSGNTAVTVTAAPAVTAPTVAAAAPSNTIKFSVLTTSGADIAGTSFFPNWGQATQYAAQTIGGRETLAYTALNYEGIQLGATTNVSSATTVHFDVWTPNVTSLGFDLISPGPTQFQVNNTLTVGTTATAGWNSIDIPLSSFTGVDLTNIIQLSFTGVTPGSGGTIYVQNIYFY